MMRLSKAWFQPHCFLILFNGPGKIALGIIRRAELCLDTDVPVVDALGSFEFAQRSCGIASSTQDDPSVKRVHRSWPRLPFQPARQFALRNGFSKMPVKELNVGIDRMVLGGIRIQCPQPRCDPSDVRDEV